MKAYLIDPDKKTINEIEYSGDWKEINELLGSRCFTCVQINESDSIFVDDEGLFAPEVSFFYHPGYPAPLANKGLVLGNDMDGNSIEPTVTLEDLEEDIHFVMPLAVINNDQEQSIHFISSRTGKAVYSE